MRTRIAVVLIAGTSLVACGQSTPMAPSASGAGVVQSGAVIRGTVVTSGAGSSVPLNGSSLASLGLVVSIVGSSRSSMVSTRGQFELDGVPPGSVELRFTGPGVDARVTLDGITEHDDIRITVRVTGTSAALEEERREHSDSGVEIEGTLTSIGPGRTLRIGSTAVVVSDGATIRRGGRSIAFTDLRLGDFVEIHGSMTNGTITATVVNLEDDEAEDDEDDDEDENDDDGEDEDEDDDDDDHGGSGRR